ncbi:hypothetical protein PLESTM_000211600 [Pleodorina starrii]|nr:hypothetical protein PLESTM_000211600 [Pleodorina starrii]
MELEVLKEFPDELEAAGRREPAATTPGAAAKTPGAASTGKKERKHDKKHKDAKENAQPLTEGKKDKEKAGGSGKGDKTEGAAREGKEGKKRRDGKKGKEGKDGEGKAAKEGKEAKDATRKRPAEETVDGGKDTVQKPKRRKVEA